MRFEKNAGTYQF